MTETIIKNSEYVKTLQGNCSCKIENPAYNFPFEIDHFQRHAFHCISNDENVLVLAHTGSGKTVPAIYAIANYIRKGKKVVYTSPIKALSNQKYKEFREIFEEKFSKEIGREISVGLMTGDNKIKPDADCVIMTTEILRNELYNIGEKGKTKKEDLFEDNFISQIGCVIFDEVHYINDKDRGHVWEETIILLDPSITLVMLSATIDRPEDFAKWIGDNKKKTVNMLPTTHRVVPLEHFIFLDDKLYKIQDKYENFSNENYDIACTAHRALMKGRRRSNQYMINELIDYMSLESMLQAIFFSFSKKNCELFAKAVTTQLITSEVSHEIGKIFDSYLHPYEEKYKSIPQYHTIKALVLKGVAFHHSGLLFILKEVVEILFQKGYIKVLFATETFAVGVNYPTRTIVFTSLEKHTNEGKRSLLTSEYKQMAGRAGRRGIDKEGNVIILPLYDFPTRPDIRTVMLGKMPHIESKFSIDYVFILKINQSETNDMKSFVDSSLYHIDYKIQQEQEFINHNKLDEEIKKFKFDDESIDFFEEYSRFYEMEENLKNMGVKMNKKQIKEKSKLLKKINNSEHKEEYQEYKKYLVVREKMRKIRWNLGDMAIRLVQENENLKNVLKEIGYLNDENKVTIKGIIASQINECNALVLTEMITQNLFDELEPEEICAVLSIFIQDIKSKDAITMNNIKVENPNIKKTLVKVNEIIEKLIDFEKCNNINVHNYGYYDIYYNYVDVIYTWASGGTLGEVFNIIETYEGNFIKNILKVNNIVNDVSSLSKVYGNIKVLPKLENIEEILVRDIVTANSLYLS